jgi:DNA-binding NarL/FixJ family response regulator
MVRIFVLDPHELTRVGLMAVLSQEEDLDICGFSESPPLALEAILELEPDMILIDLPLLGEPGVLFLEQVKTFLPDSKLVLFSANSDDQALLRAMGIGAHAFIFKGCSVSMFTCALRAVHSGASWMDPLIARRLIELNANAHNGAQQSAIASKKVAEAQAAKKDLLSPRERQVLKFLVMGWKNKQIASELGVSGDTIKTHVRHILEKLSVTTRTEAAVQATRLNLCSITATGMRAVV